MRLQHKVVLVTGSTAGIGRAIAKRCVEEGARVVIHGLENDLATELVSELGSDRAIAHIEDLAHDGCPERLTTLAVEHFGRLDAVVNNAALILPGDIHATDADLFHRIISVNTLAPLLLIKAALPHLQAARGCVLNIGSVNAWCGEPNLLPYSISKGALSTLTRNLGDSLMQQAGVRVNQINPGWVLTGNEAARKQAQGLPENWPANLPKTYAPSGRLLTPQEIASAAIVWLSDEIGPVSGQICELEQYPLIGRNAPKDLAAPTHPSC